MVVASVRILSLVYTVWNLIIVSGGVLAEDLQLEGDLTREPENGLVNKNQVMKCLQNGEVPEGLQWYTIKDDEDPELITSDGSDYKATLSDVTYRCKLDEENFADFVIEIAPGPEFRVEKFQKSIYVVEQEDLKVECDIVKQNNSDLVLFNDIQIRWYKYSKLGDDLSFLSSVGNCSEEIQTKLNWVEIIPNPNEAEPHYNTLPGEIEGTKNFKNKFLKVEDANRTEDRRAFKCIAFLKDDLKVCSESVFFVRVRDKYAALWPFLGIVAEVIVICIVIFICERRRAANAKDDLDEDEDDAQNNGKRAK